MDRQGFQAARQADKHTGWKFGIDGRKVRVGDPGARYLTVSCYSNIQ